MKHRDASTALGAALFSTRQHMGEKNPNPIFFHLNKSQVPALQNSGLAKGGPRAQASSTGLLASRRTRARKGLCTALGNESRLLNSSSRKTRSAGASRPRRLKALADSSLSKLARYREARPLPRALPESGRCLHGTSSSANPGTSPRRSLLLPPEQVK